MLHRVKKGMKKAQEMKTIQRAKEVNRGRKMEPQTNREVATGEIQGRTKRHRGIGRRISSEMKSKRRINIKTGRKEGRPHVHVRKNVDARNTIINIPTALFVACFPRHLGVYR